MQHVGQREVGPEVAGVRLLDPLQERQPLLDCRASIACSSASSSGTDSSATGAVLITSARAAGPSGRPGRGRGRASPSGPGRRAAPPSSTQRPAARVRGARGPVVERGHQRAPDVRRPDPRRDRLRVVVDLPEPGLAKRRLVPRRVAVGRCPAAADGRCRRMASSRAASSRSRAPWSRRRRSSADPRSPSRPFARSRAARASGQDDCFSRPGHVPQVVRPRPAPWRPARPRLSRGRRPVGDQPQPAADQGDRQQRRRPRPPPRAPAAGGPAGPAAASRPSGRAAIGSPRRKRRRSSASAAALA